MKKSLLSLAVLTALTGCPDDGSDGSDGTNGTDGSNGSSSTPQEWYVLMDANDFEITRSTALGSIFSIYDDGDVDGYVYGSGYRWHYKIMDNGVFRLITSARKFEIWSIDSDCRGSAHGSLYISGKTYDEFFEEDGPGDDEDGAHSVLPIFNQPFSFEIAGVVYDVNEDWSTAQTGNGHYIIDQQTGECLAGQESPGPAYALKQNDELTALAPQFTSPVTLEVVYE